MQTNGSHMERNVDESAPDPKHTSLLESTEEPIFSNSLISSNLTGGEENATKGAPDSDTDTTTRQIVDQTAQKNDVTQLDDKNQLLQDSENESTSGWPDSDSRAQVSLAISREQTPDPDSDGVSMYTDSAPGSPGSDVDYKPKTSGPSLATERAVKRPKLDASEKGVPTPGLNDSATASKPMLAEMVSKTLYTKRVSGKSIEKLWANLDKDALQSLVMLFEMSMGKTIERFEGGEHNGAKIAECQRILTENWMSERLPKSFVARLSMTKLPPVKSLLSRVKGISNENFDPLNIDQVSQRKAVFESVLSAEMKQLSSLEAYLRSQEESFNSDSEYLRDFKKTVAAQEIQARHERERFERQLNLHSSSADFPDIKLRTPSTGAFESSFDPNTDPEVRSLLGEIKDKIVDQKLPTQGLLRLCDNLDVIQSQLYSKDAEKRTGSSSRSA